MQKNSRSWRRTLAAAVVVIVLAGVIITEQKIRSLPAIWFFDVGQGDAALVQSGRSQTLIDGGPDASVLAKLGRAMPFGDDRIECVVLTHPHLDHFGGLTHVFAKYRVGTLVISGPELTSAEYVAFRQAVAQNGTAVVLVSAGDSLACDHQFVFDVLSPARRLPAHISDDGINDSSVMLRLRRVDAPKAARALAVFTGDAGFGAEEGIVRSGAAVSAFVLKVGHHGSATSSGDAFLSAVHPEFGVIGVGAKNRYGHPSPAALERLRQHGVSVRRADQDGDVAFVLAGSRPVLVGSFVQLLGLAWHQR